jgi:hypothetical protein
MHDRRFARQSPYALRGVLYIFQRDCRHFRFPRRVH